ncbi:MAG: hypothetical protein AAAB35_23135 [Phyllobacterium sp.]|uniref:hypothetical protein n=1 Tax=Phyllobacterium sp. TaxID=1871046 RepID=UPI0030F10111
MGTGARVILRVVIAVALFAAIGVGWLSLQHSNFERDRTISEWKSLSETESLLKQKPVPEAWAAGVFVSERGLNTALQSLKDAQIAYDPEFKADEDTVVTLRTITANFQPGFAWVYLRLDAYSKKRNLTVKFAGQASLVFKGIEEGEDGNAQAVFAISLLRLDPEFGWGWFNVKLRGFASELIETGLMLKLTEAVNMKLPFNNTITYDLKHDLTKTFAVRDPQDENWIKVQITVPSYELSAKIHTANAVVLDGGIWLLTDFNERPVATSINEPPPEIGADVIRKRKDLQQIRMPKLNDADIALWINGTVARLGQDKFNQLPAANRTATVKSVQFKGLLADQKWRDDILGEGGIIAALPNKGAVAATVVVNEVRMSWTKGRRLKLSFNAQADARASIDLHVDPLTGKGVGTTVGLLGNTAVASEIDAGIEISEVGSNKVVMLKPNIGCRDIKLTLKTDGKARFEEAWVSVPSLGANVTLPVGMQTAADVLIFSDLPFQTRGRGPGGKPLNVKNGNDHFLFTSAWTTADYEFVPKRVEGDDAGLWITAKLLTKFLDSEAAGFDRAAQEKKLATSASEGQVMLNCPGEPGFALTIGDLEFGDDNELVKFFQERGLPLPQIRGGVGGTGPTIPSPIAPTPEPTIPNIPSPIAPTPDPAVPNAPSPIAPMLDPTSPKIPSPIAPTPGNPVDMLRDLL